MSNWKSKEEEAEKLKLNYGKLDRKGYSPHKVYVRTRDSYGTQVGFTFLESGEGFFPGVNISKNVLPPTLANAMFQLVHEGDTPWQSVSQFVRDAIVHRIMWALDHRSELEQITNIQVARSLENLSLLKADALREGAEAYRQAMKTAKEMLDLSMMEQIRTTFWEDMTRTGDSHIPWVQERAEMFERWIAEVELAIDQNKRHNEDQLAFALMISQAEANNPDHEELA